MSTYETPDRLKNTTINMEQVEDGRGSHSEKRRIKILASREARLARITGQPQKNLDEIMQESSTDKHPEFIVTPFVQKRSEEISLATEESSSLLGSNHNRDFTVQKASRPFLLNFIVIFSVVAVISWLIFNVPYPVCWSMLAHGFIIDVCPSFPKSTFAVVFLLGFGFILLQVIRDIFIQKSRCPFRIIRNLLNIIIFYLTLLTLLSRIYTEFGYKLPLSLRQYLSDRNPPYTNFKSDYHGGCSHCSNHYNEGPDNFDFSEDMDLRFPENEDDVFGKNDL